MPGTQGEAARNTWLWWSTGKDSAWALKLLRERMDVSVSALVTTVNSEFDRVAMHATRSDLLYAQADAVGLEVHAVDIPYPCPDAVYEAAVSSLIRRAQDDGVECMAFGDLFLEDIRAYREGLLSPSRIEPLFPLWGLDTHGLAGEMIDAGVTAYLTCVDPKVLEPSFAGRPFNAGLLADLPPSVDPCGERGEFHTFVCDGPMFSHPINVEVGDLVLRDGFVFADLRSS